MPKKETVRRRNRHGSAGGMVNRFVKMLDAGLMPDRTKSKKKKTVVTVKAVPALK